MEGTSGLWNELQAGSYLFMDTEYARIGGERGGAYDEFEHSLFVLATVMSTPTPDRAIVDAGLKSYSAEKGFPWVHGAARPRGHRRVRRARPLTHRRRTPGR